MKTVREILKSCSTLRYVMSLTVILFFASGYVTPSNADIYRFVTVDGVETFTDTPNNKDAKVIVKDRRTKQAKRTATELNQKPHDISLDEIALKAVTATFKQQPDAMSSFEPHLPPVGGYVTSRVGMRIDPIDGVWRHHNGVDISIPSGTPVKPVAPGVVVYSGSRSGYGNTVLIEHDNGMITLYAHNSRLMVSERQRVDNETVLALSGSTGRSTGPHLHFEAWLSGQNITSAFLPGSDIKLPTVALAGGKQRTAARFRTETLSDGSVLFTNLP